MTENAAPQYSPEELHAVDEFEAALQRLIGLICWSVIAGEGTGSMFTMDVGERIPRIRPLKNPHLTEEQRNYNGEYGFYVQHSTWRVEYGMRVIGSWNDDNANDGPMVRALKTMVGQTVERIELRRPGLDLSLYFENGTAIHLFCETMTSKILDNYTYFVPEKSYSVETHSKLEIELRADDEIE